MHPETWKPHSIAVGEERRGERVLLLLLLVVVYAFASEKNGIIYWKQAALYLGKECFNRIQWSQPKLWVLHMQQENRVLWLKAFVPGCFEQFSWLMNGRIKWIHQHACIAALDAEGNLDCLTSSAYLKKKTWRSCHPATALSTLSQSSPHRIVSPKCIWMLGLQCHYRKLSQISASVFVRK